MNTFIRRGLTVLGIAALALIAYQFFFQFWPYYPVWRWNFRYLGLRVFHGFPFLGLLVMVGLGFARSNSFYKCSTTDQVHRKWN